MSPRYSTYLWALLSERNLPLWQVGQWMENVRAGPSQRCHGRPSLNQNSEAHMPSRRTTPLTVVCNHICDVTEGGREATHETGVVRFLRTDALVSLCPGRVRNMLVPVLLNRFCTMTLEANINRSTSNTPTIFERPITNCLSEGNSSRRR